MGIFTGIEILFFSLGVITTLLVYGLIRLNRSHNFQWYTWILAVTTIFLIVFTIAWSVSSVLEGEPQAANMGLLVFGVPSLVLFGITKRILWKKVQVDQTS